MSVYDSVLTGNWALPRGFKRCQGFRFMRDSEMNLILEYLDEIIGDSGAGDRTVHRTLDIFRETNCGIYPVMHYAN